MDFSRDNNHRIERRRFIRGSLAWVMAHLGRDSEVSIRSLRKMATLEAPTGRQVDFMLLPKSNSSVEVRVKDLWGFSADWMGRDCGEWRWQRPAYESLFEYFLRFHEGSKFFLGLFGGRVLARSTIVDRFRAEYPEIDAGSWRVEPQVEVPQFGVLYSERSVARHSSGIARLPSGNWYSNLNERLFELGRLLMVPSPAGSEDGTESPLMVVRRQRFLKFGDAVEQPMEDNFQLCRYSPILDRKLIATGDIPALREDGVYDRVHHAVCCPHVVLGAIRGEKPLEFISTVYVTLANDGTTTSWSTTHQQELPMFLWAHPYIAELLANAGELQTMPTNARENSRALDIPNRSDVEWFVIAVRRKGNPDVLCTSVEFGKQLLQVVTKLPSNRNLVAIGEVENFGSVERIAYPVSPDIGIVIRNWLEGVEDENRVVSDSHFWVARLQETSLPQLLDLARKMWQSQLVTELPEVGKQVQEKRQDDVNLSDARLPSLPEASLDSVLAAIRHGQLTTSQLRHVHDAVVEVLGKSDAGRIAEIPSSDLISTRDAARIVGVTSQTLLQHVRAGKLTAQVSGASYLYERHEVEEFAHRHRVEKGSRVPQARDPNLLTVAQTAEELGLSRSYVNRLVVSERLEAIDVNGRRVISRENLEAYRESQAKKRQ